MIIKLSRKPSGSVQIKLQNIDVSCHLLEEKDHIKCLGVMIDNSFNWKYHISYIYSRI